MKFIPRTLNFVRMYRFDGSCTMGAAIVPQFKLLEGQLDPSTTDIQLKSQHHL